MIINVTQQVEQITINASQDGNSVTLQPTIIVGSSGGGGGTGDMTKAVYDPQNIEADAFDRSNHTGTQDVSTITGLGDLAALNQVDTNEITNNAVTNLKLANMNANTFKGRLTGNGQPQDIPLADLPISDDVQNALSSKVDKRTDKAVASGTYTLLASDVDKHLMISAPCTVVVPNGLAGDLEFQGEQVGGDDTDVITFVAESGGTLNVTAAFQAKTDNAFSVFGIRTHGNDVATMYGTLKLNV